MENSISDSEIGGVDIDFPIISDPDMSVARLYGMVHEKINSVKTIRAVFIVDPENKIRTIMYYPMTVGRSTVELKRVLVALQTSDKHGIATPADWQPGDMVMISTPEDQNSKSAKKFYENSGEDYICPTWYMCMKKLK